MRQPIRLQERLILSAKNEELVARYQFTALMANQKLREGDVEGFDEYCAAHMTLAQKLGALVQSGQNA